MTRSIYQFGLRLFCGLWSAAILVCSPFEALQADKTNGAIVRDLYYGEVLFQFYRQNYFDALTHLLAAMAQDRVPHHEAEAELLLGGLHLSYGQHRQAYTIFERVLLANEDNPEVRDRAWFFLGKVLYQRGYFADAEEAFGNVGDRLPEDLEAERYNLLAQVLMAQERFADAADLLQNWDGAEDWVGYSRFNLGIALVRTGELETGAALLNKVGTMPAEGDEFRSLRDRANLALGYAFLQARLDGPVKPVLHRVRLNGPYSNKALLGVGWADAEAAAYREALVPWLELSSRDVLDTAVQESLLAVPFAFAKMNAEQQAAEHYHKALEVYDAEIERLDEAIARADSGFLVADLLQNDDVDGMGWYWQLEALPDDTQARYLYHIIADHDFQEGLKVYRDLSELQNHLLAWQTKLGPFREMLATQKFAYEQRLPRVVAAMSGNDLETMHEQYAAIEQRLATVTDTRDIVAMGSEQQQQLWARVTAIEANPAWRTGQLPEAQDKQRVLKGVLLWDLDKQFKYRLWQQQRELKEIGEQLEQAGIAGRSVNAAVDGIPYRVARLTGRIDALNPRIAELSSRVTAAMTEQVKYLQEVAVEEMSRQRNRLSVYRAQANFALASIYDRAATVTGQ